MVVTWWTGGFLCSGNLGNVFSQQMVGMHISASVASIMALYQRLIIKALYWLYCYHIDKHMAVYEYNNNGFITPKTKTELFPVWLLIPHSKLLINTDKFLIKNVNN